MIPRIAALALRQRAATSPVVLVTGPRQSGKTTLCRTTFPNHLYLSLESPDVRQDATRDPRGFLARVADGAILDEVQRAPELLSYLQGVIDEEPRRCGRFILTGSHQLLLMRDVSQTLAGRVALLTLLPLSQEELAQDGRPIGELWATILKGGFPRLHDSDVAPQRWLGDYFATYVERDVREVLEIGNLSAFETFVRLCAGRSAQLVNLSALGADAGVTQPTARSWLSALRTSYIAWPLAPWHANATKRLVKARKLHLLDSGLLCWLLGIREVEQLAHHPLRGAIFETFVFSEILKARLHRDLEPDLSHFRDHRGREIDLVLADASHAHAIEVKSTQTPFREPLAAMAALDEALCLPWPRTITRTLVYAGSETIAASDGTLRSWRDLATPSWATPAGR